MFAKLWIIALTSIAVIDGVWLFLIAKGFYAKQIGHLMAPSPQWVPVLIFYPLFAAALVYFAIMPGIASGSLIRTFLIGAAFGGIAYATYDLTNHATLKEWPLLMTVVDIAWGAFLSGAVATIAFVFVKGINS
jgi:uncharacterized membrane protein